MDGVGLDGFGLDRLEGARAHVERDIRPIDAGDPQPGEEVRGEVEPGGRGGDGDALSGVDGLVAVSIIGVGVGEPGFTTRGEDVGRKGGVSESIEEFEGGLLALDAGDPRAGIKVVPV